MSGGLHGAAPVDRCRHSHGDVAMQMPARTRARLRAGGLCVWAVRAAGGGRRGAPQAQRAPLGMRLSQGSGESDGVKAGRVSSDRKRGSTATAQNCCACEPGGCISWCICMSVYSCTDYSQTARITACVVTVVYTVYTVTETERLQTRSHRERVDFLTFVLSAFS